MFDGLKLTNKGIELLAAILAGITAGIGYSLIFNEGSSTGGTDFIIAAIKKKRPKMTLRRLTQIGKRQKNG